MWNAGDLELECGLWKMSRFKISGVWVMGIFERIAEIFPT